MNDKDIKIIYIYTQKIKIYNLCQTKLLRKKLTVVQRWHVKSSAKMLLYIKMLVAVAYSLQFLIRLVEVVSPLITFLIKYLDRVSLGARQRKWCLGGIDELFKIAVLSRRFLFISI
jgi:hypothetical protein